MSSSLVIGTAGHIDHGKSALILALTGTDPDRLNEEKSRGITIDLGFAQLALSDSLHASIVDVPGHEKFVKNMVAGTGGIDMVLMVVAADEGVMPQTREHLDICQLLGIEHGIIAVTKCDLVDDDDWLDMVESDIRKEFAESFLGDSPIVRVSANTRQGLDKLVKTLEHLGKKISTRPNEGLAFLGIDRAFSMKGFGTVITGTLVSGKLSMDDSVEVIPDLSGKLQGLKIRALQSHGQDKQRVSAGLRLAVNLSGVEKASLHRGQVLVHSGTLMPSREFEVSFELLKNAKPIKTGKKLLFHTGAAKTSATLNSIGTRQMEPGQNTFVKIRCDEPVAALPGQNFIIRGFSTIPGRGTTIGGGKILSISPPKRKARELQSWLEELNILGQGTPEQRLETVLNRAGLTGANLVELAAGIGEGKRTVNKLLAKMLPIRKVFKFDKDRDRYIAATQIKMLESHAISLLSDFHKAKPLLPGMPSEQLRTSLDPRIDPKLFRLLMSEMARHGHGVLEGEFSRLKKHRVSLDEQGTKLEVSVLALFNQAGLKPPRLAEVSAELDRSETEIRELLKHLARTEQVVHIVGDMYVQTEQLERLEQKLLQYLEKNESIDTQEFKRMVGASRKHVIPLAEYFDSKKITIRVGDNRVLRGRRKS